MKQENNSPENLIESVIDMLQQEANSLQIVGRALMPEEQARVELLLQTVDNLRRLQQPSAGGERAESVDH